MSDQQEEPTARHRPASLPSVVGSRLRALRRAQKLSVNELASRASVSAGMISQVERGLTNPSVRLLERLRTGLGVPLTDLLEADNPLDDASAPDFVRRVAHRPRFKVGSMVKELLSPHGEHDLQFMLITIPPSVSSGEVLIGPGEKAGLVQEGEIVLTLGNREERLVAGDSFQFTSTQPHSVRNPASTDARVLWIMNTRPPIIHL